MSVPRPQRGNSGDQLATPGNEILAAHLLSVSAALGVQFMFCMHPTYRCGTQQDVQEFVLALVNFMPEDPLYTGTSVSDDGWPTRHDNHS